MTYPYEVRRMMFVMTTTNQIIDRLGGTSKVAHALGLRPSTVHSWRTANHIPVWRQGDLLALAMKDGKPLATTDFPPVAERVSRTAA